MSIEGGQSNMASSSSSVRKKRQNFKFGNSDGAEVAQAEVGFKEANNYISKSIEVLIDR